MKALHTQLQAALTRLQDGTNWAHGPENLCGGKQCAWTAQESIEAARFFAAVLGVKDHKEVFDWNDAPERTWPEVKEAFIKAIAAAKAGEQ